MKSILLFLLCLAPFVHSQTYGFGLSPADSKASTTTTYTFGISLIADFSNMINIQSGASSQIIFPNDYSNRLPSGSTSCTLLNWGDPFATTNPTPTCSFSGTTLTIDNLFTKSYTLNYQFDFSIQVPNILNPMASGLTGSFFYYLFTSTGTKVATATGVGITAATMSCSVTPSPTTINQNGQMSVSFTTP